MSKNQPTTSQSIVRPPIVVVMGHVDHGKSTLLDYIRKSNIVAGEAGGITQHVAAYEVTHSHDGVSKHITFIDTPGHAAFTAIRARGANVADIAILVVAADDGVKAQTLEALAAIREAKIPFIVAINKIDKPNANIERTQATLSEHEVYLETLGGDVPWATISAKVGTNVNELLDLVCFVAEVEGYTADPSVPASGFIIEAHRDQKRGVAATLIITNGTLTSGKAVVAGAAIAPVRIMENHLGKSLKSATFSTPITLVGFDTLPSVGEQFQSYANKKESEAARAKALLDAPTIVHAAIDRTSQRYLLPVIVRADATGSLDAIIQEVGKIGDEHAGIQIIQSGLGNISENDVKTVMIADGTPIALIGFNVVIDPIATALARQHSISVELFSIVYKLTEYLETHMKASAPKRTVEEIVGTARIIRVFSSQKNEHVIGGAVTSGFMAKGATVRVMRRSTVIGVARVRNVQTNRQNVSRVENESEFGAQVEATFEIAIGDVLSSFTETQV